MGKWKVGDRSWLGHITNELAEENRLKRIELLLKTMEMGISKDTPLVKEIRKDLAEEEIES